MGKEIIIVIYYLLIINLLSCSGNTNNMLYNYIWYLIILNLNSIIFNNSYNIYINNIILFFDVILSILIIREIYLINKKNEENKEDKKNDNLYLKILYYICLINILIFVYSTYNTYIKQHTINTI
tara:strand:+ start:1820 stop:2194 length:375 start_codon:yes stop_codon:yes gene_type:complete